MARKWEIVRAGILRRIQHLSPGDRLPSIVALRKEFGVSQHSVCRALDSLERDGLLVKRTRDGIRVAEPPARKASAVRIAYAAWHGQDENGTGFRHPFFHPLMRAISQAFNQSEYEGAIYLFSHHGIEGSKETLERDIAERRIQGLIIASFHLSQSDPAFLRQYGVSTVLIGADPLDSGFPAIVFNSVKGGLLAAQAVCRMGRLPAAVITGRALSPAVQAFLMACEANELHIPDPYRIHCAADFGMPEQAIAQGRAGAAALLELPERPQVVWITDDMAAMGALQVLHDAGIHVPRDLAVVVSTSTTCVFSHPVCRIADNPEHAGNLAARVLFALLRGERIDQELIYVEPQLLDDPESFSESAVAAEPGLPVDA